MAAVTPSETKSETKSDTKIHESKSESRRRKRSRSRGRSKSRDRNRSKDRNKSKGRSRSRERRRSKSSHRRRRSRSRSWDRSRHHGRPWRSPPRWSDRFSNGRRDRYGDGSRSRSPRKYGDELPPEERDQRTIFVMQLAARVRSRDLEEFFSAIGKVREVRLIMDNKTRRHKGIAYIEFQDISSVPLALALNGHKLCDHPIIIQPTQAEKNRAAASTTSVQRGVSGPMRLYVGSLHFNITEDMLKGIFEPFGRIDKIELMKDPESGRSKGYGFITFHDAEDAKKAIEQLNGFELAGRPMKVNHVTERTDGMIQGLSILDSDELDRTGIDLGTTGRLQLMAKLAEGTGIELPQAAVSVLQIGQLIHTVNYT